LFKIPVSTLFLGKNLVDLPECDSTNTYASDLSARGSVAEGTVVITPRQFLGRGQRGNTWDAQAGANLTFSIILYPRFLEPAKQFLLSQAVSLAVWDFLLSLGIPDASIKWPNDIIVDDKKICGILIENQVRGAVFTQSIVGIGLNINQVDFKWAHATSVALATGRQHDLNWMFSELLRCLESRYLQIRQQPAAINSGYLKHLYWKNESHTFRIGEAEFPGVIEGVDVAGRLVVMRENDGIATFAAREITYVK
jgi:BirA family biotin operon repressor/biotin-[acetyl-CoA-carboxylase] ligase